MKKSKVDAIIKRKEAEAERRGIGIGYNQGRAQKEREYEMLLSPLDDGVCVLGEQPKHMSIKVAVGDTYHTRVIDMKYPGEFNRLLGTNIATFTPVQRCQSFASGARVIWYEWQFRGLSMY